MSADALSFETKSPDNPGCQQVEEWWVLAKKNQSGNLDDIADWNKHEKIRQLADSECVKHNHEYLE